MTNYNKTSTTLFAFKGMQEIKKLKSELNEHRYYLERNVARRTEQLTRRIELLESCNTTLCGKLAMYKKDLAELQTSEQEPGDSPVKLYVLNTDVQRAEAA